MESRAWFLLLLQRDCIKVGLTEKQGIDSSESSLQSLEDGRKEEHAHTDTLFPEIDAFSPPKWPLQKSVSFSRHAGMPEPLNSESGVSPPLALTLANSYSLWPASLI